MSPTLLSARLKRLGDAGVITKSGAGRKTAYELTEAGRELTPIVQLLGAWGHRWVQTSLVVEDLDASLLAAMTAVWTCQITFKEAVRRGEIEVFGDATLVEKLEGWLQSSALSRLGSLGGLPNLKWQAA